jgi:hypothetical protein
MNRVDPAALTLYGAAFGAIIGGMIGMGGTYTAIGSAAGLALSLWQVFTADTIRQNHGENFCTYVDTVLGLVGVVSAFHGFRLAIQDIQLWSQTQKPPTANEDGGPVTSLQRPPGGNWEPEYYMGGRRPETPMGYSDEGLASGAMNAASRRVSNVPQELLVLNQRTRPVIAEFLRNANRFKSEFALLYDSDGNLIAMRHGGESSVFFSEGEYRAANGGSFLHNHPEGRPLSGADLYLANQVRLNEISAYGPGGQISTLRGNNGTSITFPDIYIVREYTRWLGRQGQTHSHTSLQQWLNTVLENFTYEGQG